MLRGLVLLRGRRHRLDANPYPARVSRSLLLRRVRVVPLADPITVPTPVDVLMVDGRIAQIGSDLPVPADGDRLDAAGRWAIPGLWDAHVHAAQWVRTARMLPLAAATCAEDVLAAVAEHLAEQSDDRVLLGFGYRSAGWPRPGSVAELDAVSAGRAVVLVSGDAHNGWLNSAALDLLGAAPRVGPVTENEWFELLRRVERLPGARPSPAEFRAPLAQLAARGLTGMVDFEFGNSFDDWPERIGAGADSLRVRCAVYPHQLTEVIGRGLRTGDRLPGAAGLASMGPLKIISDGSLGTRTAWTHQPYSDGPATAEHPCGQANYSAGELAALLRDARVAGLEVAVHAIGDRANAAALDAFATTGVHGSIEHAQLIAPEDVDRLAALSVVASVQPAHLLDDRDLTERLWGDRSANAFPLRTMIDAGVDVRFGSDAPVAALDPWLAIASAVHRSGDDRPGWHPEQSLTIREALAASVDGKRLAPGGPADLVLLDHDPLAHHGDPDATRDALRATTAALTICAGRVTHRAM